MRITSRFLYNEHVNQLHEINKKKTYIEKYISIKIECEQKVFQHWIDGESIPTLDLHVLKRARTVLLPYRKLHFCIILYVCMSLGAWIYFVDIFQTVKSSNICNGNGKRITHRVNNCECALSRHKMILNKDWAFNHHIQFQTFESYYCLLNYILHLCCLYMLVSVFG